MYQWDIPHLPEKISRQEYVDIIFNIGHKHRHGYATIISAVQLGDFFVSFTGPRISVSNNNDSYDLYDIMNELVPQVYSIELAYVTTIITAKFNEDYGYRNTALAMNDTKNRYVVKMEWEICILIKFNVKIYNFISVIGNKLYTDSNIGRFRNFGPQFWDLSKDVCMDRELLSMNPKALICGFILLVRYDKLKASIQYRKRKFYNMMKQISYECEVPLIDILREYILVKRTNIPSHESLILVTQTDSNCEMQQNYEINSKCQLLIPDSIPDPNDNPILSHIQIPSLENLENMKKLWT
jgi:hypothetical protein